LKFTFATAATSVCFVIYWLNMWPRGHGRNMYFDAPQRQNFAKNALHVTMVVNASFEFYRLSLSP